MQCRLMLRSEVTFSQLTEHGERDLLRHSTVQYSTAKYSTVQYSTVQHSTGRCHCNAELVAAGGGKMGEGIN